MLGFYAILLFKEKTKSSSSSLLAECGAAARWESEREPFKIKEKKEATTDLRWIFSDLASYFLWKKLSNSALFRDKSETDWDRPEMTKIKKVFRSEKSVKRGKKLIYHSLNTHLSLTFILCFFIGCVFEICLTYLGKNEFPSLASTPLEICLSKSHQWLHPLRSTNYAISWKRLVTLTNHF